MAIPQELEKELFTDKTFADFTFTDTDQDRCSFRVHKVVLARHSPKLKQFLLQHKNRSKLLDLLPHFKRYRDTDKDGIKRSLMDVVQYCYLGKYVGRGCTTKRDFSAVTSHLLTMSVASDLEIIDLVSVSANYFEVAFWVYIENASPEESKAVFERCLAKAIFQYEGYTMKAYDLGCDVAVQVFAGYVSKLKDDGKLEAALELVEMVPIKEHEELEQNKDVQEILGLVEEIRRGKEDARKNVLKRKRGHDEGSAV